ncbi:Cytosine-specific methyltransferase [Hyella patelloides LEGE 07179]|uniref:DNA (cytosine-5-)-methyltransferase n=2 Tax=Hyella TaxID=945733 RepID=A0A563VJB3_9CYAN|nr:HpaII family restriction endonuclease [Hyella patelloides]VEP11534.1 Cytosine-specific methyltransferase [Hyella patelloides LEGE 07179]
MMVTNLKEVIYFLYCRYFRGKKPSAYIIENVRHLLKHDNGRTFKIICEHLESVGYTVNYKILKASEYGLPQHRPRIFIVGFNKELIDTFWAFNFPLPIPLKMTMSDVWEGNCSRDIGFTLRVGGRRSPIDDRRNWDGYLVDGEVVRIKPEQGIKMMGFPNNFQFPVSNTEAMKQLGNSVCVDVVYHVAGQVKEYLENNTIKKANKERQLKGRLNKGEWSEFYAFMRLLLDKYLSFGNKEGNPLNEYVVVFKIKHNKADIEYLKNNGQVEIRDLLGTKIKTLTVKELIEQISIEEIYQTIESSKGSSFVMPKVQEYFELLKINSFKGSSYSKGDINISFNHDGIQYSSQNVDIKSDIGSLPTLLNASSATNFIFRINNFNADIDAINDIKTKYKIRDRLLRIRELNSTLEFVKCEKEVHSNNLKKVDSLMPEILAKMLTKYYSGEGAKITDLVTNENEICRVKDYLKAVLLGMFPSKNWDGNYTANGSILVRKQGDLVLYHVIKDNILKDYLFYNTKLDTPSSTRHRFGNLYKEKNQTFIKLNLQIRFI